MRATRVSLRDFRNYERAEVELAESLTVVTGPNGAGKTNLLEALYFGCTGRSCRTANERECVRFGAAVARLELTTAEHVHETYPELTVRHGLRAGDTAEARFQSGEIANV